MWYAFLRLLWLIALPVTNKTGAKTFRKSTKDLPDSIFIAHHKSCSHCIIRHCNVWTGVSLDKEIDFSKVCAIVFFFWYHSPDQVALRQQDSRHRGWSFWWSAEFKIFVSKISFCFSTCLPKAIHLMVPMTTWPCKRPVYRFNNNFLQQKFILKTFFF